MTDARYGKVDSDGELEELAVLLNKAFGHAGDVELSRKWLSEHGPDAPRQVRAGGGLAAGLLRLPMGHFFGGRSVSTLGIAGVGVQPELRGQGYAKRIMADALREARAGGFALSSLYASTFGLYRWLGYERAGQRFSVGVDPLHLRARDAGARMRPLREDDEPVVRRLYEQFARFGAGMLDRSDDNWRRARNPARKPSQGVLILEDDEPTGYARWAQLECDEGPFELLVSDHAVATPVAARRLLAFLADHGTMARKVFWFTGPGEPLLAMLDTTRYELKHSADWLLRLLDVRAALEARGYPAGVQAELHLELEDSLFEENRGRFVLRVAAGRGALERGGDGRLCSDVRGLAPLYSGYVSAAQLRLTGQVAADDATCATAAAVFAGPAPWMPDYF